MNTRDALGRTVILIFVIVALALVAGQLLGQPVLVGYVETGSMEPTLSPGDGFVAIPAQLAGPIEEGDVVVFQAEALHGGDLTTHRIVGTTDRGYITKGDANPFTDQANDEPPVKDPQIVAEVLQISGDIVVVPHLGTVVTGIRDGLETFQRTLAIQTGMSSLLGVQGLAYLFFAATLLAYGGAVLRDRGRHTRSRNRPSRDTGMDTRLFLGAFSLLLMVSATAYMVAPAGAYEFGVISTDTPSDRPDVILQGESKNQTYIVPNGGLVPIHAFLEPASEGIAIHPREIYVGSHSQVNATVTLSAPPENGYFRRFLVEHRYLAVLPASTIRALYHVHPWTPIVVIDALIGGGFYLLGIALVGGGRVRSRKRTRSRSRS